MESDKTWAEQSNLYLIRPSLDKIWSLSTMRLGNRLTKKNKKRQSSKILCLKTTLFLYLKTTLFKLIKTHKYQFSAIRRFIYTSFETCHHPLYVKRLQRGAATVKTLGYTLTALNFFHLAFLTSIGLIHLCHNVERKQRTQDGQISKNHTSEDA